MPITPAGAMPAIAAGLASAGQLGTGMPKVATAIANGMDTWIHTLPVITADTGTAGAGQGFLPVVFPTPLFISNFTVAFAGQGILGTMAPNFILGLSNGLTVALLQGIITTTHPSVGVGTSVVKFASVPAIPAMLAAFASLQMTQVGSIKMATAIGIGLTNAFAAFTTVSPIVGSPSPTASAGVGTGLIA